MLDPGKGEKVFSSADLGLFQATSERFSQIFQELGKGKEVFGLIHADLHQNNYLFKKKEVRAIDFQDCGWGYYLFDIALTLSEGQDRKKLEPTDWAIQQAAFFDGYQTVRLLPTDYDQQLKTFEAMRVIDTVNWILSWPHLELKRWGAEIP